MKKISVLILLILIGIVFFNNCEDTTRPEEFAIEEINFSYSNSEIFISIVVNPDRITEVGSVNFTVFNQDENDEVVAQGQLEDNGKNGDIIANNGEYTKRFNKILDPGKYRTLVEVMQNGERIDSTSRTLLVDPPPPSISLVERTEVFVDSSFAFYSVEVEDENGLDYIEGVYCQLFFPDDQGSGSIDPLYDNGENADEQADDGIYTYAFVLPQPLPYYGTYEFKFWAVNRAELHSDTLTFEIEAPLVDLIAPDRGSYSAGETINLEWQTKLVDSLEIAYDPSFSRDTPEFEIIETIAANEGSYQWDTPETLQTDSLKLKISSVKRPFISDLSEGLLSIK